MNWLSCEVPKNSFSAATTAACASPESISAAASGRQGTPCAAASACGPVRAGRSAQWSVTASAGATAITSAAGAQIVVTDVQRVAKTLWRHQGTVASGEVSEGDTVTVAVDGGHRHGSTQGHSGTHLVHAALRQVLGSGAHQAGSSRSRG